MKFCDVVFFAMWYDPYKFLTGKSFPEKGRQMQKAIKWLNTERWEFQGKINMIYILVHENSHWNYLPKQLSISWDVWNKKRMYF